MAAFDARDTAELLRRLGKAADGVVVVGGQALNAWAELYSERVPELRDEGPFTSKDFDLLGDRHAMRGCAERLGGTCVFPDPFEDHGPNAGVVTFKADGRPVQLDFLRELYGVDAARVRRSAVLMELLDRRGRPIGSRFRIMQPIVLLESRACNVTGLGRRDAHSLRQLRVAVICAREFLRDLLADGSIRAVLDLHERIFWFCTKSQRGRRTLVETGVDPFSAIITDPPLPEEFRLVRYPQMAAALQRVRARLPRPAV